MLLCFDCILLLFYLYTGLLLFNLWISFSSVFIKLYLIFEHFCISFSCFSVFFILKMFLLSCVFHHSCLSLIYDSILFVSFGLKQFIPLISCTGVVVRSRFGFSPSKDCRNIFAVDIKFLIMTVKLFSLNGAVLVLFALVGVDKIWWPFVKGDSIGDHHYS